MWTEIQNLTRGDVFIIDDTGATATVGYVRTRGGKAIVFCVDYISPVMFATDMVLTV